MDTRADTRADTLTAATGATGLVDPMAPVPYRVVARHPDTADTATVTLAPVGAPVGTPEPGQFVMAWAFGVGEIPISVSVVDGERLGLTVRAVGAVSTAIAATPVDDVVGLRGPYGTAWPTPGARGQDTAVVAGGLGLAPLRLAIDRLVAAAAPEPATGVTVVIGARTPEHVLYRDAIDGWRDAGARVHVTVDAADRSWHGAVGTATALLERLGDRYDTALVCGPEPMMTSAARAVTRLGTDPEAVWVSLERNMHCGVAHCGRCQLGPLLLCRDGAVVRWSQVAELLEVRGR